MFYLNVSFGERPEGHSFMTAIPPKLFFMTRLSDLSKHAHLLINWKWCIRDWLLTGLGDPSTLQGQEAQMFTALGLISVLSS